MPEGKNVRLSKNVSPIKYQITVKPDLEAFVFEGEEIIELKIAKQTKRIILHAKELEILSAEIVHKSVHKEKDFWAGKMRYNQRAETAEFTFGKILPKGKAVMKLSFKGILNDKMRGFYRSSYKHQGRLKHLATSQFEATDARRAFPCFDEPEKKAVFELNFIIPSNFSAISNTLPTQIIEHQAGYKLVKFAPTPKMSSYLVAMVIGDFENLEARTKQEVVVRVHTTPGKKHQAKFALGCATKILEFYNQYFDIPYPLNTLDLIAIPDFAHGAMENWGAVTYRETALLIDEEHSSTANKQYVALVIAHELAHQWFGNLVTMQWWTHLWLNEGFASYIEYLAVDHLFPKWDVWTQFAYNDMGAALQLDAFKNTHPIEVKVHHPDEISEIFDAISYSKGASVIRMLANYLGEKIFRDGLRYYLKEYAYKNASTQELWQALERVSKKPVKKLMKNWTSKSGYPILKVIDQGKVLKISQQRFYGNTRNENSGGFWRIPISLQTNSSPKKNFLLNSSDIKVKKPRGAWLKLNIGETGFYRVAYTKSLLSELTGPIKQKQIKAIDRWGVLRDAFALAESGYHSTDYALTLAESYKRENDYTVWVELVLNLEKLEQLLFGTKIYGEFKTFALGLLKPILIKTNWYPKAGEPHQTTLLRTLILNASGRFGDEKTLRTAKRMFASALSQKAAFHPDIRGVLYNLAAQAGDEKTYATLLKLHNLAGLQEEQRRLGRAMTNFQTPGEIKNCLRFVLGPRVRSQDAPLYLAALLSNPFARDLTWDFIKKRWSLLLNRYGAGGHLLARIIQPLWHYSSAKMAAEIQAFFKTHPAPGCQRTIQQVLEKIRNNQIWLKRDLEIVEKFLSDRKLN